MPAPVRELFRDHSVFGEVVLRTIRIDGDDWRAAVIRVAPGDDRAEEPALHVGVLRSDDEDVAVLSRVRRTLFFAIPIALGALFTFVRRANAELDRNGVDRRSLEKAREVFARINSVLDVVPEAAGPDPELARWVEEKLAARKAARVRA